MKKVFRFSVLLAVIAIVMAGCSKKDDESGGSKSGGAKLSPPTWIQGTWEDETGVISYKFTKDDILINGIVSFKLVYNVTVGDCKASTKEKTNNSSLYEVTVTGTCEGEKGSATFSFKKGDGTYIEFTGDSDEYGSEGDEITLFKK